MQPLHDEHTTADQLLVRPRHDHRALVRGGQDPRDVEHVLGLEPEVELLDDRLREELDQRRRVGQRADGDAPHERGCDPAHGREVLAHRVRDGRALHLHDHGFTRAQRGRVHLRDRCRRDRRALELREHGLERRTEIGLDGLADRVERFGRHLVAQQAELEHELLGEDALARADDLAELDVRGAKAFERLAQTAREPGTRDRGIARTTLAHVPAAEGDTEAGTGDEHAPDGRDEAPTRELGDLSTGRGAHGVEARHPRERSPIHQPRGLVGEGADVQIARFRHGRTVLPGATAPRFEPN